MNSPTSEVNSPDVAILSELIRRHSATSADLTGCRTFIDIARVVAKHLLDEKQFVSLSAFVFDEDGVFRGIRTIASANRKQVFEGDFDVQLSDDTMPDRLRDSMFAKHPLVLDIPEFVAENPAFKAWSEVFHLQSMLLMPLIQEGEVVGHIAINSLDKKFAPSAPELDIYHALANQISLIIHANKLLEDSHEARSIASQLVSANRLISTSTNHAEMLRAIMSVMPENVAYVALVTFKTVLREGQNPTGVYMNAVINAGNEVEYPDVVDKLTPEQSEKLTDIVQSLRSGAPFTHANIDSLGSKYALVNHVNYFNTKPTDAVTSVGLLVGDYLHGLLVYGINNIGDAGELESDNLLIVADQVAIVLENRRLLETAANTLNETQMLYYINRELLVSESGLDVLRTLKRHLAQTAKSLSLVAVEWNAATDEVLSVVLQDIIDDKGERSPQKNLINRNTPDMIGKYKEEWALQGDDIDFIDDAVRIAEFRPAVKNSLDVGIYASVVIPIREGPRLIQQIFITFSEKQEFDDSTRRLYKAIQDQVMLVVQNRRLLNQLEGSLAETRTLYEAIQPLLEAESNLDILEALKNTISVDAEALSMTRAGWDSTGTHLTSMVMEAFINDNGRGEPDSELISRMSDQERKDIETGWKKMPETIAFIQDYEQVVAEDPSLRTSYEQGIRSSILMPVHHEGHLSELISVAYTTPQIFDARTRRLYSTFYSQLKIIVQNRRLVRDTQISAAQLGNQLRVVSTLNQLGTTLPTAENEAELAAMVCDALLRALPVGHVSFWLPDPDGESIVVIGESPDIIGVGKKAPRNHALQDAMIEIQGPLFIEHPDRDERITSSMGAFQKKMGIRAFALVPLLDARAGYVGTIQLDLMAPEHSLSSANLDTAQTMTNQAAVTLQNIFLLRDTQRQAQQLQQIANFAQLVQTTFDAREILEITLHNAHDLLKFDEFNILLYNPESGVMELVAQQYGDVQKISVQEASAVTLEGTVAGEVWQQQYTLSVQDMQEQTKLQHNFVNDVQSIVAVPLYLRGTVQGVVEVAKLIPDGFNSTDVAIFQQLASQLAVALESADAYTQNQRLAKSKAQVNEISSSLQRQTELDRIMTVTARELGKALGAKRARIRLGSPDNKSNTE